jgi:uncharacterized protein with HXXEE motif
VYTVELPHPWLLLFPATYLLHILEEYYAGEGFHRWMRRVARITLAPAQFIAINSLLWMAMLVATLTASYFAKQGWVIVALAVIVSINGVGHLVGTLYTGVYSPGLATGLVLWVPLGIYALVRTLPLLSATQLWIGVLAGLVIQGMVSLLAIVLGQHRPRPAD